MMKIETKRKRIEALLMTKSAKGVRYGLHITPNTQPTMHYISTKYIFNIYIPYIEQHVIILNPHLSRYQP